MRVLGLGGRRFAVKERPPERVTLRRPAADRRIGEHERDLRQARVGALEVEHPAGIEKRLTTVCPFRGAERKPCAARPQTSPESSGNIVAKVIVIPPCRLQPEIVF